jgi:hypothetical protein
MTTQAAKTITPSTSSQTAVAKNVYTTGAVTVAAIPSNYEDVGTETTEYTALNAELEEVINSLPEAGGGSGGGSDIETCTVTINMEEGSGYCFILLTTFDGSRLKTTTVNSSSVITNAIKNSRMCYFYAEGTGHREIYPSSGIDLQEMLTSLYDAEDNSIILGQLTISSDTTFTWY